MKNPVEVLGRVKCVGPALILTVAASASQATEMVHFAPHRAVYEVSLTKSTSGSGVSGMTGRMVYELSGSACEGYTQNMRFVTRMSNQEGGETLNDLRSSSWEEVAGKRLRFSSTQYQNEDVAEASQGDATRAKGANSAIVELVKPAKSHIALPDGIFFPMQHASALIESAKAGRTLFSADVYDGSEKGNKYYTTSAVIGKMVDPAARKTFASIKDAARLASLQSWPMSVSYFETGHDKQDAPPSYELSYDFYENGVTTSLNIDYGDFAIKGDLKQLTFLPETNCSAARDH